MRTPAWILDGAREALALVFPVVCAGCGVADRSLCESCFAESSRALHPFTRGQLVGWAGGLYQPPLSRAVAAFKDGGRSDLATPLARVLEGAISAALADTEQKDVELCIPPLSAKSFKKRGFDTLDQLIRLMSLRAPPVLGFGRAREDQASLTAESRVRNAAGAYVATEPLVDRKLLLLDDIVTTGSTLREMARAIQSAGGQVIGAAIIAETPLRLGKRGHTV